MVEEVYRQGLKSKSYDGVLLRRYNYTKYHLYDGRVWCCPMIVPFGTLGDKGGKSRIKL